MVAQVAADEPDTEPKMPQPSTFTCRSRPGMRPSHGARPRNISSDSLVRNRISPIQMKSGRAASSHDAALPQILVASTAPAGILPAANCMPIQPQASRLMAIHTPDPSSTTSTTEIRIEMPRRSMDCPLHAAGGRALDDLVGGPGRLLLVAGLVAAGDVHQLIDDGDEEDDQAAGIAELRDPERDDEDARRHVIEPPGRDDEVDGVPGEKADEGR